MLLSKQNGTLGKHSVFFSKRDLIFTSIIIPFAGAASLICQGDMEQKRSDLSVKYKFFL